MNNLELNMLIAALFVYALWAFGVRRLFLERTRQAMFSVRHDLFITALDHSIDFNDTNYRKVEAFINANIRFSHKFNLLRLLVTAFAFGGQLPKSGVFLGFLNSLKQRENDAFAKALLNLIFRVQLLALRQILWSFLPTALLYLIAVIFVRSRERMKEIGATYFEKPSESIEGLVVSSELSWGI